MKKTALLISIFCFMTTFAIAQKNKQRWAKIQPVQMLIEQTSNEQPNSNPILNEQVEKKYSKFFTPVKIIQKPFPSKNGQDCSQGKVILRVTFLATGEIGKIWVIYGLGHGLTENSIEAAKKIKFEPALKSGNSVSVTKIIEYPFTIY